MPPAKSSDIPRPVSALIARLRGRIRRYVLFEAISLILLFLVVAFWVVLAIDYLPVKSGFEELTKTTRAFFLATVGIVVAWMLWKFLGQRVFARLESHSLALLIEKHYPEFNESLVTTVELATRKDAVDAEMLDNTRNRAAAMVDNVDVSRLLNSQRLRTSMVLAMISVISVAASAIAAPQFMQQAVNRLCMLGDDKWPRQCQIEIVGIKVKRDNLIEGIDELGQTIRLDNDEFRVAKGASITLLVRAQHGDDAKTDLPEACVFRYWTDDGGGGQQIMKRVGAPRDGYQMFTLDGQPLRGILASIQFDIRGGDHRIGPYTIRSVDQPSIVQTDLDCKFPDYMVDRESMRWTPRTIAWSGQSQLPQGTEVRIRATSNKRLEKVYVLDVTSREMTTIRPNELSFDFPIGRIMENRAFQFFLLDTDGVVSEQAHLVAIEPVEDEPPSVESSLVGIGTAVTPDVRIPIVGKIEDDYATARQWIEIETPITDVLTSDFETNKDGQITTDLDFRKWRQQSRDNLELPTGGDNTLALVVKAIDRFNLREVANVGIGDRYELDLVSPGQLLRILERLEVGQRRRLEQIYGEMNNARNYLLRTRSKAEQSSDGAEPGDRIEPGEESPDDGIRSEELRLLFAQRCLVQIEKSTEEIRGISSEFENIRMQLINNRVDSEDRKERLSNRIVTPLELIANQSMRQLDENVKRLEEVLEQLQIDPTDTTISRSADIEANGAVEQANLVLQQIDQVLGVLIKYETQNELLEIVRQMIRKQKEIADRTKKERKRKAFEGLLDE